MLLKVIIYYFFSFEEPFIDVSVGGQSMNDNQGALQVWAVTAHGRVNCKIYSQSGLNEYIF